MRRLQPRHLSASFALIAIGSACYGAGCGPDFQSCEQRLDCGTGGSGTGGDGTGASGAGANVGGSGGTGGSTPSSGCDPSDGLTVDDGCGVFVRRGAPSAGATGAKGKPFATISEALAKSATAPKKVLFLCAEEFTEDLVIPSGWTVQGGFTSCGSAWVFDEAERSTIKPSSETKHTTLSPGNETTTLRSLKLASNVPKNETPGQSAVGLVINDTRANISHCEIIASNGTNGAKGKDGAPSPSPTDPKSADIVGNKGNAPATAAQVLGADPKESPHCSESIGGSGGTSSKSTGGPGSTGEPLGTPNGGAGASTTNCSPGTNGDGGTVGDHGNGASGDDSLGSVSPSGFEPGLSGGVGGQGKPGQGGGGGGGGKGDGAKTGGSGGGGGAGGCGGFGGEGGKSGGASIGIIVLGGKQLTLNDVQIELGAGGAGGPGGESGTPGVGGNGGFGGQGDDVPSSGCPGGNGGSGGVGGRGGGGRGGHAIGIAVRGGTAPTEGFSVQGGSAGPGGAGGDEEGAGEGGMREETFVFQP